MHMSARTAACLSNDAIPEEMLTVAPLFCSSQVRMYRNQEHAQLKHTKRRCMHRNLSQGRGCTSAPQTAVRNCNCAFCCSKHSVLIVLQVFWLMLIFYGAPARLPAYDTTPSACPTYTLVNMTRAPPFSLQTDIPVPNPSGVDLCCVPGSLEDPCLVQDGGVYLEGRMSGFCMSTKNVYCTSVDEDMYMAVVTYPCFVQDPGQPGTTLGFS